MANPESWNAVSKLAETEKALRARGFVGNSSTAGRYACCRTRSRRPQAYAESRQKAEEKRDVFLGWCRKDGHRSAGETLLRDWDRMVTFYQFPKEHWKHLRTTNVVESPFAALRLRTALTGTGQGLSRQQGDCSPVYRLEVFDFC